MMAFKTRTFFNGGLKLVVEIEVPAPVRTVAL